MTKVRQILGYHHQGTKLKEISRLTGVSRNTIKRYIRQFVVEELTWEDVGRMSDYELDMLFANLTDIQADLRLEHLQSLLPVFEKKLKRQGYTLTRLWEEYKRDHPDGYGHTQFTSITGCMPIRSNLSCILSIRPAIRCISILQARNCTSQIKPPER